MCHSVGVEGCVWVQAQATQEATRAATNRWPPFWAIAAMVLLGFDEFVAVLYNPLWLLLGLVIFLFGKTVYQASPSAPHTTYCHQSLSCSDCIYPFTKCSPLQHKRSNAMRGTH